MQRTTPKGACLVLESEASQKGNDFTTHAELPPVQFIFSPIFIGVFMSLLVTLEGKPSLVVPKLKQEWLSSVFVNWQLWIPFQFLNFYFVPPKLQVLAANFVALAWTVILSYKAHKEVVAK